MTGLQQRCFLQLLHRLLCSRRSLGTLPGPIWSVKLCCASSETRRGIYVQELALATPKSVSDLQQTYDTDVKQEYIDGDKNQQQQQQHLHHTGSQLRLESLSSFPFTERDFHSMERSIMLFLHRSG